MLAGGIGAGAINILNNSGIDVVRGCSGDATELVKLYLSGSVKDSGSCCHQHEAHHQEGHKCSHN
jgi:predicted Fe-Mo cluster-binding NifX family protein